MGRYSHLVSPLAVGPVTLRNRIVQTGHSKTFSEHGLDSERELDYLVERARGGTGLLITGARAIHPTVGMPATAMTRGWVRDGIDVDRRLTAAVQEHGAAIFAQLVHMGGMFSSDWADDLHALWGPSAVPSLVTGETPKVMERADLEEVVEWWARSAAIARESGFDGVELHFAHGYLVQQFLSPVYNKRDDDYGGSFENRARLAREIVDCVRGRVGADYVVGVRIPLGDSADFDGALTVADAARLASELEASGYVDYVSASVGGLKKALEISPSDLPDGHLVEAAAEVKRATGLPVLAIGGIRDPRHADEILAAGHADLVGMTRAQIADPELARKVVEGRDDEIVHCIRGNQGCIGRVAKLLPLRCTVNPAAGREREFGHGTLTRAGAPRRWLVVGGGPAGMKAAETLARRGHDVTLLEREQRLGGQVNLILETPGRAPFAVLTRDLEASLRRHGVDVRLGREASAADVRELAPDAVIVATGAVPEWNGFSSFAPLVERLPGVERDHVLTAWDVLRGARAGGERVVVLDGDGTRCASGVADVLLDRGHRVELVTPLPMLFADAAPTADLPILYARLFGKGLAHRLNSWARAIEARSVVVENLYTQTVTTIEADAVVLATGSRVDDRLYHELAGEVEELHRIGDCVAPRRLDHAVYEGYLAGRELWSTEERYLDAGPRASRPVTV